MSQREKILLMLILMSGISTHNSTGSTGKAPRMIAGLEHLKLSLTDYTTPYLMGNSQSAEVQDPSLVKPVIISPNPVHDNHILTANGDEPVWKIIDMQGILLTQGIIQSPEEWINVSGQKSEVFIIEVKSHKVFSLAMQQFIKE